MGERDAGAKNLSEAEKKQIRKTRLSNPGMKAKLGYEAVDPEPWYNARKPKRTFRDQHEIEPVPFFEDTASRAPDLFLAKPSRCCNSLKCQPVYR